METIIIVKKSTGDFVQTYEVEMHNGYNGWGGIYATAAYAHLAVPSNETFETVEYNAQQNALVSSASKKTAMIATIKARAVAIVIEDCQHRLNEIAKLYPSLQLVTFPILRECAYRWQDLDGAARTAAVTAYVNETSTYYTALIAKAPFAGQTPIVSEVTTEATAIIQKAEAWDRYTNSCTRVKSTVENAINALTGSYATVKNGIDTIFAGISWPELV